MLTLERKLASYFTTSLILFKFPPIVLKADTTAVATYPTDARAAARPHREPAGIEAT